MEYDVTDDTVPSKQTNTQQLLPGTIIVHIFLHNSIVIPYYEFISYRECKGTIHNCAKKKMYLTCCLSLYIDIKYSTDTGVHKNS